MFEVDFQGHAVKNFQFLMQILVPYHQNLYLTGFFGGFLHTMGHIEPKM